MKTTTRGTLRVLISLIYIVWGILAPITAFRALLALDLWGIVSAGEGVLMLIAGFFGLIDVKRSKIRTLGVIIFVVAVIFIVLSLPTINITSIITAALAWLFIIVVN